MKAIFKREFKSYFTSPIGYIVLSIIWAYSTMLFVTMFSSGSPDITVVFSSMFSMILFLLPLLTMRTFSEEKRQKTDQLYMTAPTSLLGVVLGKFFAALTVFLIGISLTLVFEFIIMIYIVPEWLVYFSNMVGTTLMASAFIALGVFISACTESQIVSAIISFAFATIMMILDVVVTLFNVSWITAAAEWFSFSDRYNSFTNGTVDISNILFFISLTVIFIFLTVRKLDKKRWA